MSALLPNRFLFRFEVIVHRWRGAVRLDGDLAKWGDRHRLPPLHELDGQPGFAELHLAWCDDGLLLAARVRGKRQAPKCDAVRFRQSDHVRLMTDMRDARDIRRATRYCQHFYFMPAGGGKGGRDPLGGAAHIARATADAPLAPAGSIAVAARAARDGYDLEALVPATVLSGWDPAGSPRIGFLTMAENHELRQQSLTVGDDLNWWCDPSTWVTGVLSAE
ncbi:MAG: hypothetical protein U1A27_10935 [Phycisphaerae bacterium]